MTNSIPSSIGEASEVLDGPQGQRAHKDTIAHTKRLERKLYQVREGVWSQVGNGLSNQNFIEGPEGLIVIDTGESCEEMAASFGEIRKHTNAPVVAVIYTHFHYVQGTSALWNKDEKPSDIWGHADIEKNLHRVGVEVNAVASRGLVHQFGLLLPKDGPDGIVNCALGEHFRLEENSPWTPGFIPPNKTFKKPIKEVIAGLEVEMFPAPSDANDSITIWFPQIKVCVNNLLWPTLFNVFAIRGEEYRDPRILINGIEKMLSLQAEYVLGTHGPPISGSKEISKNLSLYRDSIQFLWDQTVRGINLGLTLGELTEFVQLPDVYKNQYFTQQLYGLVEHHVRQIHNGLRGWFDGDESALLPVPPGEKAQKLIDGFGGEESVRNEISKAVETDDLRWALELSTWLIRQEENEHGRLDSGTEKDRQQLADILRLIAQRTTATNVRNWCLTRALELEKKLNLDRFRSHRFNEKQVLTQPVEIYVHVLRLIVIPELINGLDVRIGWRFEDNSTVGLHLRNGVAVQTRGDENDATLVIKLADWASVLSERSTLEKILEQEKAGVEGNRELFIKAVRCFDNSSLHLNY